ncbi:MAG: aminoacetone oxidase family FAD-binding enzyme [Clostridia bacterium]|nr:aminoacetone oxidase family FAD-binding enzyme [Clostridia bacterium]
MTAKIYDIAIIGAGAAGLVSAISAAQTSDKIKVVLLESNDRVGKKILATGNGKCNLANTDEDVKSNYFSYDVSFIEKVFEKINYKDNLKFFSELGLVCRTDDEGRIYPYSQHASSVLDCLRNECDRLGVETICSFKTNLIKKNINNFIISSDNSTIICNSLIVATGGMSYLINKKSLSGYDILKSFGHKTTELYPALVALKTDAPIKSLKGIRSPAVVSLFENGKKVQSESGEVQFTEHGISGIAVMQLSQRVSRGNVQNNRIKFDVSIDLMPSHTEDEIMSIINSNVKRSPETLTVELLCGIFHKMLARAIAIKALNGRLPERSNLLTQEQIINISRTIKDFRFKVTSTMGFSNSQVTGGGVMLDTFSPYTMESTVVEGLYAVGEVLDVVGACGGFNLNWSWSSGRIAGESAAKRSVKND